jgi:hypothetical protein
MELVSIASVPTEIDFLATKNSKNLLMVEYLQFKILKLN